MVLEQRKVPLKGWCILASTGGFLAGVVLALVVAFLTCPLSYLVLYVRSWEGLLVVGVLASAITGLVLAWLLKDPIHEGQVPPAQ